MNLIAAVDENWAIGYKNELLVRIPSDQKFFREETTGKVVVLGRKTMETFPGGKPLKNRTNIVRFFFYNRLAYFRTPYFLFRDKERNVILIL